MNPKDLYFNVKKIIKNIGNVLNFPAIKKIGISVGIRTFFVKSNRAKIGNVMKQSKTTVKVKTRKGIKALSFFRGKVLSTQNAALKIKNSAKILTKNKKSVSVLGAKSTNKVQTIPTMAMTHTFVRGSSTQNVETASESVGSDWENIQNLEGQIDGNLSRLSEGLVLVQGDLIGDFRNINGKDLLDITKVELISYHRTIGINLLASGLNIRIRNGLLGAPQTVDNINNNENHLVNPRVYDITELVRDNVSNEVEWNTIRALQVVYNGVIAVDLGLTNYMVDATYLRVSFENEEQIILN